MSFSGIVRPFNARRAFDAPRQDCGAFRLH